MTHITITLIENNNPEKEIELKRTFENATIEVMLLHIYRQCLIHCDKNKRLAYIDFFEEEHCEKH